MMTPEQKFARWVRVSIASFLLMFVYFIVADIWIPLTPDSTVMRVVTPVSPRVSGYVAAVHVHNNSQVKRGDLLFELDDTPFRNKVEAAQIALEQARLSNEQLDAQVADVGLNRADGLLAALPGGANLIQIRLRDVLQGAQLLVAIKGHFVVTRGQHGGFQAGLRGSDLRIQLFVGQAC
ncbi:biotin/lipoyl-binding protein, partial [Enterobacter roggenkampii]|uniref:biotin/lipoyl-binding protein n=1 Tax=Enterobacter roggenkampii TaxID=1812935 RepID=UPI0021BBBC6D